MVYQVIMMEININYLRDLLPIEINPLEWKMNKIIYSFALFIAVITFIFCIISGISLFTCFVRSSIVFLGILFTFTIAGQILKVVIVMGNNSNKEKEKKVPQE